ncbi:tRNA (cytidine(56)-2'-O)-methyltransferase [Candidatus Bathyarchaeota archaeon]|nr:MAG: tRNA (cytidine(56)-2'-O)-methyltransferase [Candidatus Bathyarchaeota archaeon]RLG97946.1 MAG: tRNA (cytidine(56)-2'-O)-methyltransferase [Candidatus Bathyarchaeota archaeon]RLI23143.1 MAG: tRNA (cytidine(56)-2'-O)-methyltransferase [Candidatus Bathyarchaeota archaeon]
MPKVVVLRWGHRPRDQRLTTHVALTARALGASGIILAETSDQTVRRSVEKVVKNWGGPFFIEENASVKDTVRRWRENGGIVVHLTAYGENIETSDVMDRIKASGRDVLVIVGSQKVPPEFFTEEISDFNVAIGNQPHSECSSLAVFLDRYFEGKELSKKFEGAKLMIIPQRRGKKVVKLSD